MAGRAAEELYADDYNVEGVHLDVKQMMLECVTNDPAKKEELRSEALRRVAEVLRQNWFKLEALVEALLDNKELDRKSIETLID